MDYLIAMILFLLGISCSGVALYFGLRHGWYMDWIGVVAMVFSMIAYIGFVFGKMGS